MISDLLCRRKKGIFLQIKGETGFGNSSYETLALSAFSGDWYRTSFRYKTSWGSSDRHRDRTTSAPLFLPQRQFQPGRLLIATGITVLVSLLLSTLWTMDDLGIRYFNRKDYEIKMVGKYVGTVMPIVFGFYGVLSLFGEFPKVRLSSICFRLLLSYIPLSLSSASSTPTLSGGT